MIKIQTENGNRNALKPAAIKPAKNKLRQIIYRAGCCFVVSMIVSQAAAGEDKAISFAAVYTGDAWWNTTGGIDTGTRYLSNIDLQLETRFGGGILFLYGLYTNDSVLSEDLIGDVQVVSNIDSTQVFRMYEAWYYHDLGTDTATIKAGLIDLNSGFDAIEPAGLFINSSHGIGPDFSQTGENGPSIFPSTSLGAEFEIIPNDLWHMRIGIFDAIPNDPEDPDSEKISLGDGALILSEINYTTYAGTRFALGAWGYTSDFDTIDGRRKGGNWGTYGFISGDLYTSSDGNGLSGWLRYGLADNNDINVLKSYMGAGLVYTGFLAARPEDQLGLAVGTALISNAAKQAAGIIGESAENAEINIELTYRAQITEWLTLQPDIQYVIDPGIVGGLDNAFVVGLRFELAVGY